MGHDESRLRVAPKEREQRAGLLIVNRVQRILHDQEPRRAGERASDHALLSRVGRRFGGPHVSPGIQAALVHHLIRVLDPKKGGGEPAAASLVAKLGAKAEIARELAYRLYTLSERKKRAPEALAYNGLVQSWPEITRLAREGGRPKIEQVGLFAEAEE